MAKAMNFNTAAALILLVFLAGCQYSSAARPLVNVFTPNSITALNLALLGDDKVGNSPKTSVSDQFVLPSELGTDSQNLIQATSEKIGGRKYRTLVLNVLSKRTVPPSGPSKRINGLNN